jgi:hypothetical protein
MEVRQTDTVAFVRHYECKLMDMLSRKEFDIYELARDKAKVKLLDSVLRDPDLSPNNPDIKEYVT